MAEAVRRRRGAAREALIAAAQAEFDAVGFDGTDTNRIARRAGYAPQTFYCHFGDKAAIFAEVFARFVESDYAVIRDALPHGPTAVADAVIRHHAHSRLFRRSLRQLSITDPVVRAARVAVRRTQMAELCASVSGMTAPRALALLLAVDRLADAAAEGELAELGVTDAAGLVTELWQRLAGGTPEDIAPLARLTKAKR